MAKLLFLPGAGGAAAFWSPVADRLLPERVRRLLSWPGLGREPPQSDIRSADDLVSMVAAEMDEPVDLIALGASLSGDAKLRASSGIWMASKKPNFAASSGSFRTILGGPSGQAITPPHVGEVHWWRTHGVPG